MSEFDRDEVSEIQSIVVSRLDSLHVELKHISRQLDAISERNDDHEHRIRALEITNAQTPLKMALLAAGSGTLAGGGIGALIKAIFGG